MESNAKIQYKNDDYRQLDTFYKNKIQQIHIVGEYAKTMLKDYNKALQFVDDYFQLNYSSFLRKYFPRGRRDEITRNITPTKFHQLFGTLSPRQLEIIKDSQTKYIVVAAGPGSGKTRILVHKLASLLLMEDIKHEQMLMLTFSRASATEFKKRLLALIGNAANFIEIKTFHSYCFDLLGRVGSIEKSDTIIKTATQKIINGEVERSRITRSVLVIDEAQDMDEHEFGLMSALINLNDEMRVIAVGDDDQNIYEFRGSDSKYFAQFVRSKASKKFELIENYRSKKNIVEFSNSFAGTIKSRLKSTPINANQRDSGKIRIVKYNSAYLVEPLVNDILSCELVGTVGILTKTNDEALQITGMLLKNKIPAKLIQSNSDFNLFNLFELRQFYNELKLDDSTPIINSDVWHNAKKAFEKKYYSSNNFEICRDLIKDFEITNPRIKYKSDLEVFIRESKLEDFISQTGEIVYVSTIHKAKGKEFDNVFLLLDNFSVSSDAEKRQLYVAMTRAKNNLTIHYNSDFLDFIKHDTIVRISSTEQYHKPKYLTLHLTHKDVYLGYFRYIQNRISYLESGSVLSINEQGLLNSKNEIVVKFSKNFLTTKQSLERKGYRLIEAKVHFILYWNCSNEKNEGEKEIIIVLPELCFLCSQITI